MELGFNVNAGPLSQIAVPILSLSSAVQIAVGSYGWWQARKRTKTLAQTLSAAGGTLVTTSTFNFAVYGKVRAGNRLRGVALENRSLVTVDLPKGSTAVPQDPGQACLRALTTVLLSFYTHEGTTRLLSEMLPQYLINMAQNDAELKIDGPFYTSLSEYVKSVGVEEDSSYFRQELLKYVEEKELELGHVDTNAVREIGVIGLGDYMKVAGVVKWILTPLHKRPSPVYATRSLFAWKIANAMFKVGYKVLPYLRPITTEVDYMRSMGSENAAHLSNVILVTASVGKTDAFECKTSIFGVNFLKPRVIPIRAIPWVAFRHLANRDGQANTANLADVWDFTFEEVRLALVGPLSSGDTGTLFKTHNSSSCKVIRTEHKDLLRAWSPHFAQFLERPMQNFLPRQHGAQARIDDMATYNSQLRGSRHWIPPPSTIFEDWHIMATMVLATLYAAATLSLLDSGSSAGPQTEVAFNPHNVFGTALLDWSTSFRKTFVQSQVEGDEWTRTMFDLLAGRWERRPLDGDYFQLDNPGQLPTGALGIQRNGLLVIPDFIVNPSHKLYRQHVFHIHGGQLLTLPTDDEGFIKSCLIEGEPVTPRYDHLNEENTPHRGPPPKMRVDIEPSWESDPQKVNFVGRMSGHQVATFSPMGLAHKLSHQHHCRCTADASLQLPRHVVDADQKWRSWLRLDLVDLVKWGSRVHVPDDMRLLVDVGTNEVALLLAVGVLDLATLTIVNTCFRCQYQDLDNREDMLVIVNAQDKPIQWIGDHIELAEHGRT